MASAALASNDRRDVPRDEVHYRARAVGGDAQPLSLLVVNLSAQGLMARTDKDRPEGERLRITLPVVGMVWAEIRWSLGGRVGLELDRPIGVVDYYELLTAMVQGSR